MKIEIKLPSNKWFFSTFALLILLVISILGKPFDLRKLTGRSIEVLSQNEVGEKVIRYINENLVQAGEAELVSIEDMGYFYRILTSYQGREIPVYVSKDGEYLFLNMFNLSQKIERPTQTTQPSQPSTFDAPDREKTNVKFFVMSFCPFGNQAESGLEPVYRLLGEKVEWEPHYVIYSNYGGYPNYCLDKEEKYCSMHGIQELHQDIRELCVWKYYPHSTWWDFVMKVNSKCNSRNADTCWESLAREVGIDVNKIKNCQKNEAISLLEEEVKLNQKYGVRGSPTVFINDMMYRGSRTPEAYKQAICSGFISPPSECSQTLGGTSSSSQGHC